MDLASMLKSLGDEEPSGENLEYDAAFIDMELASQPGEERQMGDQILEAEDPDYGEMSKTALAILERSHDLRAAVTLGEAVLHTKGLQAFAEVTTYIRGCLEEYWDTCHPQLDEDDGDPIMRINAVQGLSASDRVLRALRRTALTDSRVFGKMTLRHIEVAEGISVPGPDMDSTPDLGGISAAFQDTDDAVLKDLGEAATQALEDVGAIDAAFSEKTPGQGPDLDPLINALKQIQKFLSKHGGGAYTPDDTSSGEPAAPPVAAGGGASAPSGGGAINSPADVSKTLERIIDYYARTEPSSPVPVILERAKRLVSADFLTIIEDMAKDGLDEVRRIGGIKNPDDY
jgi:type VI secretion system protein ImpA